MVATADSGYLVYAQDVQAPLFDPVKNPRVGQTRAALAMIDSRIAAGQVLSQMVADELKRIGASPTP